VASATIAIFSKEIIPWMRNERGRPLEKGGTDPKVVRVVQARTP